MATGAADEPSVGMNADLDGRNQPITDFTKGTLSR
jgi:hypothetical protein